MKKIDMFEIGMIFLALFVSSFVITVDVIEIKTNLKHTAITENFDSVSEKWYVSISYLGYNDISDSYNYMVYWYEENEDGIFDRQYTSLILPMPPTTAILYVEQNETAIKSSYIMKGKP